MAKDASTTNGSVGCESMKRPSLARHRILIISFLIILVAFSVSYLAKNDSILCVFNHKTCDKIPTTTKKSKTLESKANSNDVDPKVRQALEMVQFIDQLLDSNLDDTVTVEQSVIRLRDVLKFNNVHFAPRISSIVNMDPFKFAKFNLKRPCTLWPDIFSCTKMYALNCFLVTFLTALISEDAI